jgi:hypothetical protein
MPGTIEKTTRGISPILLVLAALCFLLPFAAVSCNSAAGGALGSGLSQLGGSAANAAPQETACLNDLSNGKDFVTYSGVNLVAGSDPTINSSACDTTATTTTDRGGVGAQPLLIAALVVIAVGILATVLRARVRPLVAGAAALIAGVLVIIGGDTAQSDITSKITSSGGTSSFSSLGVGSLGNFFNVHASIGFWLVLVALFLAVLVNLGALAPRLRLTAAGTATTVPPPGGYPPGQQPGVAVPPQPPPPPSPATSPPPDAPEQQPPLS